MPELVEVVEPPSIFLPPVKAIKTILPDVISKALASIRFIYLPEVRGSSRRRDNPNRFPRVKHEALEALRADVFERSFTVQWLTRFISFASKDDNISPLIPPRILEEAAALLAICAGSAASGNITRTFTFTLHGQNNLVSHDLSVVLQDAAFDPSDTLEGTSSVGMQTWGGSCVLAEMIADNPSSFGISSRNTNCTPLRILELGAGTGLVSIVAAKIVERLRPSKEYAMPLGSNVKSDVVIATDFHPSVLINLRSNYMANFPSQFGTDHDPKMAPSVFVYPLDWATFHEAYTQDPISALVDLPKPLQETFDLIVGADIIYEHTHALWIHTCVKHFLKRPHLSLTSSFFHLIIPLRQTHTKESSSIELVFPPALDTPCSRHASGISNEESELAIFYQEDIICDAYTDHGKDEVVYRYYRIGWT